MGVSHSLGVLAAGVAIVAPTAVLARTGADVPARPQGQASVVRLVSGGVPRDYRLFRPADLPPGPRPLLVALHPLHATAASFEATTGLDAGAAAAGAVVAYPDGVGRSWDAGTCCAPAAASRVDDVRFLAQVLRDVATRVPVDPQRVGFAGFSNGALMSYRFACERSRAVAVVVAVAGDLVAPRCRLGRPVSLLHVHGLRDPIIPFSGSVWSPIDAAGFPEVIRAVDRIAALDGCAGPQGDGGGDGGGNGGSGVETRSAANCAAGVTVRLVTCPALGHAWPRGPGAASRYGVDATAATWAFVRAAWSRDS